MAKKAFKVKLKAQGGGTGMTVPFSVEEAFGSKARVPVRGAINGFPFRSSVFPMGGAHMMVVNRATREGAGVTAGDTVRVVMEVDTEPRVVAVPADFKKALAESKEVKAAFDRLSYTHRKEFVAWIEGAKKDETRARRIEKALAMLAVGKHL
ncbi:MAG TPA: YdeI/OmpD-associated family protein [Blastocatellia bacterium]|jgi:ribosomal protein S5|nr:YdeI/OmpD-associated family protein [Blastocatellia bacterium]